MLLDESLAALHQGNIPNCDKSWLQQLLLGLAPLFFSGVNPVIDAETARAYCRDAWTFPYGYESNQWQRQTRRAEFEVEYTVARRRSLATHERFWLGSSALQRLDAAEQAMQGNEEPMYSAQWSLLKMRLGIDRRDTSEILTAARRYLEIGKQVPWVLRDHPSERHQYSRYRNSAIAKTRSLEHELPQIEEAAQG